MKKIVSTFAFALLLGGLTFAEDMKPAVTLGAWGRAVFVPYITGADDAQSLLAASWGAPARIGFTIAGSSADVGFEADLDADGGSVGVSDQWKVWIKPFEGAKLSLGRSYEDTLRGSTDFGTYDWLRLANNIGGDDYVFNRADTTGAQFTYTAGNVFVFVAVGGLGTPQLFNDTVLKTTQEGLGYTIPDVGLVRAQALGHAATATADAYQEIQAAFRLTSVQNLYLDIGANFPSVSDAAGYTFKTSAAVNYTMDKTVFHGEFRYISNKVGDAGYDLGVGADYSMDGGIGIGGDVRYYSKTQADNGTDPLTTVGVFLTKGFSNGLVGIGVQYATKTATGTASWQTATAIAGRDADASQIVIPVRVEYWF
jgi:hypothetical protein